MTMLKRILLAALWLPLAALAQSYPSPTFNNVTVQGTLTAASQSFTNPLPVSSGGTGVSSLTLYNTLVGSGTNIGFVAPGANNTIYASNGTTAYPSFKTAATLGLAQLTGGTFTGSVALSYATPTIFLNDTSGTGHAFLAYQNNGTNLWDVQSNTSTSAFIVDRYVAGTAVDSPLSISNSTGLVSIIDGLAVTGTVSGTGFSNYLASPPSIGGTTAAAGTFTTLNSTAGAINGSIGQTTPAAGSFTTISASSTITPSQTAGIVGTTTNNNANAGSVGEVLTATSTATSMTSGTPVNCASVSLTAGDWDVTGVVEYVAAGSTTTSGYTTGLNTTSATYQTITGSFLNVQQTFGLSVGAGTASYQSAPVTRFSLASTTTVFLVGAASFATSTMTCNGFIRARRMR
jgi:hypothetical protein